MGFGLLRLSMSSSLLLPSCGTSAKAPIDDVTSAVAANADCMGVAPDSPLTAAASECPGR